MRAPPVACLLMCLVASGCARTQERSPEVLASEERRDLPAYETIAAAHNARVANLDKVWSRATVVIDSIDREGERRRDQGEGHLQVVRPRSLALSMGKLGETGLYLGSSDAHYWWFDLVGGGDENAAWIGRHDRAGETSLSEYGAPVHPLDLIEMLGVLPLPESAEVFGPTDRVSWGDGGRVLVVLPARSGHRLLEFEPGTYRMRRAAIFDSSGGLLARAEVRRYGEVRLVEGGGNWPEMPDRLFIEVPRERVTVSLSLYGMENRGSRQSDAPFDLARLVDAYRIDRVFDIDEEAAAAAARRP